jgi:ABC-2 type transport system permease protein
VYLISAFRWSFYDTADVPIGISIVMIFLFLTVCIGVVCWIFQTGYRLKN